MLLRSLSLCRERTAKALGVPVGTVWKRNSIPPLWSRWQGSRGVRLFQSKKSSFLEIVERDARGKCDQAAGASPKNSTAHPQLKQRIGRSSPRASHCCGEYSRCWVSSCRGHFGLRQMYWYAMIAPPVGALNPGWVRVFGLFPKFAGLFSELPQGVLQFAE